MGFRERPEYQGWRDAVFRLFGQKCIRCGYAGNLHAHHVMPVEDYPELAFEPTNGVPLCGNCHVAIKGNELAHVDDLKQRQRAILDGNNAPVANDVPTEPALRDRACAEPSNAVVISKRTATSFTHRWCARRRAALWTWHAGLTVGAVRGSDSGDQPPAGPRGHDLDAATVRHRGPCKGDVAGGSPGVTPSRGTANPGTDEGPFR